MRKDFKAVDFVVERSDLRRSKFVAAVVPDEAALRPGQVLLRVTDFAFTANNVTYAVAGDMMSYWNFFPAAEGWGSIPVWGFGDVIRSKHDGVAVGARYFGYFPMSTHLLVQAGDVGPSGFVDASPHRAALPVVYNRYRAVAEDPGYEAARESQQMLLWPLFMTSFMLDDFLADNEFFGARAVVLSSASSKTALGLAFLLFQNRRSNCEVIGLTSPGNVEFVSGLGCYDRVVSYEEVTSLPNDVPVVFVDMAGNGPVVVALHRHFQGNMKYSCQVGLTHWERGEREQELPGPQPTLFFAPSQIEKRTKDWGAAGLQERFAQAWRQFLEASDGWIRVVRQSGEPAVRNVYLDTLEGRSRPDEGHVLSL